MRLDRPAGADMMVAREAIPMNFDKQNARLSFQLRDLRRRIERLEREHAQHCERRLSAGEPFDEGEDRDKSIVHSERR
jgi:hypothetical protein